MNIAVIVCVAISATIFGVVLLRHRLQQVGQFFEFNARANNIFMRNERIMAPITFQELLSMYKVDPDKWSLTPRDAQYVIPDPHGAVKYSWLYFHVVFKDVKDYVQYAKFIKDLEAQKELQKEMELDNLHRKNLAIVLESVQHDIDRLKEKSTNEVKYAYSIMKEVEDRMQ